MNNFDYQLITNDEYLFSYVNRMPKTGETIHGHHFQSGFGGKGANQIVAASKLKSKTAFIGKLGSDAWASSYKGNFTENGVNIDFLEVVEDEVFK